LGVWSLMGMLKRYVVIFNAATRDSDTLRCTGRLFGPVNE
jgi:hypothetical protein